MGNISPSTTEAEKRPRSMSCQVKPAQIHPHHGGRVDFSGLSEATTQSSRQSFHVEEHPEEEQEECHRDASQPIYLHTFQLLVSFYVEVVSFFVILARYTSCSAVFFSFLPRTCLVLPSVSLLYIEEAVKNISLLWEESGVVVFLG